MKLKMVKTTKGSENGFTVNTYVEGEVYHVADLSLAKHFLKCGAAVEVSENKDVNSDEKSEKRAKVEDKALKGADYENKSANKKVK